MSPQMLSSSKGVTWCALYSTVAFLVVLFNLVTMVTFIFDTRLRRRRSMYCLMNLAVADMLVGALPMPLAVYTFGLMSLLWGKLENLTPTWIMFLTGAHMFTGFLSLLSLALVSLERAFAVVYPLRMRAVKSRIREKFHRDSTGSLRMRRVTNKRSETKQNGNKSKQRKRRKYSEEESRIKPLLTGEMDSPYRGGTRHLSYCRVVVGCHVGDAYRAYRGFFRVGDADSGSPAVADAVVTSCRAVIASTSFHQKTSTKVKELNRPLKCVMFCKLFHRACFALALIALAGDIESNPGYLALNDIKNTRGLKIAHLNIRSLINKTDSLRLEGIDSRTIDVLTLSETWLDSQTADAEINLPGFVCARRDRSGTKEGYGGVATFVRDDLAFRLRNDINTGGQECLWIELIREKCKPTLICSAYRAPDADLTSFISSLQDKETITADRIVHNKHNKRPSRQTASSIINIT
ncbi:predicted protein [Nematostella vectensis]|uniref:G-protein coupled receptors family 1 profile domain-containing protein n=1 Tax=Nematostella vectensis TaxID=45351 RepID=A7RXT7_NEMVE|nr:predicted protein [Nematostella vectensis]|eukprot:XP_001635742.1 predicted protein [Nematostella vectensis]